MHVASSASHAASTSANRVALANNASFLVKVMLTQAPPPCLLSSMPTRFEATACLAQRVLGGAGGERRPGSSTVGSARCFGLTGPTQWVSQKGSARVQAGAGARLLGSRHDGLEVM